MKGAPYEIFRKDLLGTPVWMETVLDLETAKLHMIELAARSPGEYFVFSQGESQEIVSSTLTTPVCVSSLASVFSLLGNESHFFCLELGRRLSADKCLCVRHALGDVK